MSRVRFVALLAATAGVVAACASGGSQSWEGAPGNISEQNPVQISPLLPPGGEGGGQGSTSAPSSGSSSPAKRGTEDPNVVAKHVVAPVGLALLPDGTALVGERTTGKILDVQPTAGQPTPVVKVLRGLDTSGDGGLLDLVLSPHYGEDNLVYAYITTPTDNRVVDFTLSGPVTPVLTGIPRGRTGNAGRLVFSANGDLYVGTGDAGRPRLAADPASLAGKVLRISDIGAPAPGNPTPSSPVFTRGHGGLAGLCAAATGQVFDVEARADLIGEVNLLAPGSYYGWPTTTPSSKAAAAVLPSTARSPGGCGIQNQTIYVTSLDGKRLLVASLSGSGRSLAPKAFRVALGAKYGRLRTVVVAPDGAVWLTTSNRDGHGTPVADDERVLRIVLNAGGSSPV